MSRNCERNKLKKMFKIMFIMIIIVALVLGSIYVSFRVIYPKKYQDIVEKYAKQYSVDSTLVYAIIKAESNFKENIVSNSGAVGLMQLMDATATEVANNMGDNNFDTSTLHDPETNINLGIKYFSELLKKYDNNIVLALAAYNAGAGNVQKWINAGIIKYDGSNAENIPFQETNMYVRKILRDYEIYKKIY